MTRWKMLLVHWVCLAFAIGCTVVALALALMYASKESWYFVGVWTICAALGVRAIRHDVRELRRFIANDYAYARGPAVETIQLGGTVIGVADERLEAGAAVEIDMASGRLRAAREKPYPSSAEAEKAVGTGTWSNAFAMEPEEQLVSKSASSTITRHRDSGVLIVDEISDVRAVDTPEERERAERWFKERVPTRTDKETNGVDH